MRNRFYKSVHPQLFNVKYKFVYLQLFNVKYNLFNFNCLTSSFCFPKNIFFCKQKRTDVYGRASLVLGFQLNRENDDLLSSRHIEIFEVQHPVHEHAKLQIPDKRYRTNTRLEFFEGPTVPQL